MKKSKLLFILLSVLGMVVTFAFINVDKKNSPTAKKPNISWSWRTILDLKPLVLMAVLPIIRPGSIKWPKAASGLSIVILSLCVLLQGSDYDR